MNARKPAASEKWVTEVDGKCCYSGPPWKSMTLKDKARAIIECYECGYRVDQSIAALLGATGKDGKPSGSAVQSFMNYHRNLIPDWIRDERKKVRTNHGIAHARRYAATLS